MGLDIFLDSVVLSRIQALREGHKICIQKVPERVFYLLDVMSLRYQCSVSPVTLPILQAESNAVAVAHGAELGCYCRSWELMVPSYDLRRCKTCWGCWGMPAGYEHFRTHTFEELRQRTLPQKLSYLLILGSWVEFLLFSLVFAFWYLFFWSKATSCWCWIACFSPAPGHLFYF